MKTTDLPTDRWTASCLVAFGILMCSCGHSAEAPQASPPWLKATAATVSLIATGDSVASSLTVTNTGTTAQTIQFAPCTYLGPLSLRAYAAGAANPAWDSALDNNAPCFTATESAELKPGASHTFLQVNDVNEILGDSLAPGSYVLTASGRNLMPATTTELGSATLSLSKHAVAAATFSLTTDSPVYSATASGTGFISYSFTVITRYVNNGSTPASLLTCDSRHPYFNVWGVGNNVGNSPYDPLSTCDVPLPTLTVAPGAVRFDTLSIVGPTTTGADGVASTPLYGQVLLSFRGGTGCSWALSQLCVRQPSTVFAIRLPQ